MRSVYAGVVCLVLSGCVHPPAADEATRDDRHFDAMSVRTLFRSEIVGAPRNDESWFEDVWLAGEPGYAEAANMLYAYLDTFGRPEVTAVAQSSPDARLLTEPVEDASGEERRLLFAFVFVPEEDDARVSAIELLPAGEAVERFERFLAEEGALRREFD